MNETLASYLAHAEPSVDLQFVQTARRPNHFNGNVGAIAIVFVITDNTADRVALVGFRSALLAAALQSPGTNTFELYPRLLQPTPRANEQSASYRSNGSAIGSGG